MRWRRNWEGGCNELQTGFPVSPGQACVRSVCNCVCTMLYCRVDSVCPKRHAFRHVQSVCFKCCKCGLLATCPVVHPV